MVTSDYIENEFLKGRSMEDLPEEEQDDLMKAFLVVSVDPEFVPPAEDLTIEELEEEKVASSPEFESATEIYNTTFYGLSSSLIFGSIFMILLTMKLDDSLNSGANWWVVFSPFWIERGGRLILCLYKCCCSAISGEEVVLYAGEDFPAQFEADGSNEEELNGDDIEATAEKEEISDGNGTNVFPESNGTSVKDVNKGKNENKNAASTGGNVETCDKPSASSSADDNVGSDCGSTNDGDTDDNDKIHLDQDTYDAFQSAYHEAEKTAQQERSQSCTEACVLIFQIILLALVVAKIEKNFDSVDPNDVGFNVFWILFPFFLIFGLTLCCCAILIFGAAPEPTEGETDEVVNDPENPPVTENPGGVVNPTEEEVAAVIEISIAPEKEIDESTPKKSDESDAPSDGNMDDLD